MATSRRAMLGGAAAVLGGAGAGGRAAAGISEPIVELRQYKIVHGRRAEFIPLFEREFVDSQEAIGMRIVGEFRDTDDPDRFTWIREFPSYATRAALLNTFYTGPVWLAHRAEANPMLDDNDNVLLLRPAYPGSGFGPIERRDGVHAVGLVVATIHYLWKEPKEAFLDFFATHGRPALERAQLQVLGAFVREERPNDFPRLPVREGERLFVWFTRCRDDAAYRRAMSVFRGQGGHRRGSEWLLPDLEERPAQVLRLSPAPRSRLQAA